MRSSAKFTEKKYFLCLLLIALVFLSTADMTLAGDQRPKVGLVLSGGGAKGFAHIGTLQLLDSLGIRPDYIAGTSMGGIAGALYAIGYSGKELEHLVTSLDWRELFTDRPKRENLPFLLKKYDGQHQLKFALEGFRPTIPEAMVIGQKVSLLFAALTVEYASVDNFDNLPVPYRCVAADLISGKEIVLDKGSLARAMRSTMSLPTIFKPVEWGDSLLIDGGMANNFPVDVARAMGADIIIGVDVGAPLKARSEIKNVVDVFEQTINLVGLDRIEKNRQQTDILIVPDISQFSSADFEEESIRHLVQIGKDAVAQGRAQLIELARDLANFSKPQPQKHLTKKNMEEWLIYRLEISGINKLSFKFIYNQLGIKPGAKFIELDLENRISALYALGYFQTIDYDIRLLGENKVVLKINVVEKTLRELRVGFNYDDHYQLVGLASFIGTDLIIPGGRLEAELRFAGKTTFQIKPALPSRSMDIPIFPFLRYYFWDIPIPIYDVHGDQIAEYKDKGNSFAIGLDIPIDKSWMLEGEFSLQYMNVKPDVGLSDSSLFPKYDDVLHEIILTSTIDRLDDVLLPRRGGYFFVKYSSSKKRLGSDLEYDRIELMAKYFHTFGQAHTFMMNGYYGWGNNIPIYKNFLSGGPDTFVGIDYFQLMAQKITIARVDYRYEFQKNLFLKLAANIAFDYQSEGMRPPVNNSIISGWGIGAIFNSILGPMEMMYSRGDKSPLNPGETQYNFYFKAGYIF